MQDMFGDRFAEYLSKERRPYRLSFKYHEDNITLDPDPRGLSAAHNLAMAALGVPEFPKT